MNDLIPNELGIWIECCKKQCKKWRYTIDYDDPLLVPEIWYCHMNSDQSMNRCSVPESLILEEDEIFVETKFKAGCIVWAKVRGHPWCPAMVDFCHDYRCYYWFDKANTNVPTQYHVSFLSGNINTHAWVRSRFVKSFAGNQDPTFAFKLKVCGKAISTHQRTYIIEGCKIAKAALRLSISRRLKKFNYNSWRLSHRFQNPLIGSGKTPPPSSDSQTSGESPENAVAGPSGTKKSAAPKNTRTKNQLISKTPHQNLEKPAPLSKKKLTRAAAKESAQRNANEAKSSRQEEPAVENSEASVQMASTNTKKQNKMEDLDDTRSINSISLKDMSDSQAPGRPFTAMSKAVVDLRSEDDSPALDIVTNKRLGNEEKGREIAIDESDEEIIPNSQENTPSIRSFSRILTDSNKQTDKYMSSEKQPEKEWSFEIIGRKEFEAVLKRISPEITKAKRLSLHKVKSVVEERRKGFVSVGQKSMSESLISNNNKENHPEESMYRRALSVFKKRDENSFSYMANYRRGIIPARKPLPEIFTDPEESRKKRMERISQMADEDDKRMFQEQREDLIKEIQGLGSASPSGVGNRPSLKPQYKFIERPNLDYLLSSDDDSF